LLACPPVKTLLLIFNSNKALLSEDVRDIVSSGVSQEHRRGNTGPRVIVLATYVHLGRTAAMNLAPSTSKPFDARLRLVMALLSEGNISG
jgi:hypothetical protein